MHQKLFDLTRLHISIDGMPAVVITSFRKKLTHRLSTTCESEYTVAMDVTLDQMRTFVAEKHRRRDQHLADLHARAAQQARQILELLIAGGNPTRIVQWGSVLHPHLFREYSDIDFAVQGLPDAQSLAELQDRAQRIADFPVDIVNLDRIEPEFRAVILAKGRIVYERQ